MSVALGLDIGGTTLRAALVDSSGGLLKVAKRRIAERTPEALLHDLAQLIDELAPIPEGVPLGAGLAAVMRQPQGVVMVAPNLGWTDVPFGALLRARFGRPVRLVNDLDAITMGEATRGAGRGAAHVLCVFVGTGVGMGAVVHGQILEGASGMATELGHIKIGSFATGRLCGCGERGCLEAYASGRHLPELLAEQVASGLSCPTFAQHRHEPQALTADCIERAATTGEPAAVALWQETASLLGRAIGNLVTVFNPQVLVLGGGVLQAAPSLHEATVNEIRAYAARPQLADVTIAKSELGDDAGLVGAGLLAQTPQR